MAIDINDQSVASNIKLNLAWPLAFGDSTYNAFVQAYVVDLTNPKAPALVLYQLNTKDPNSLAVGSIETTTEWLIALMQDVINIDLKNSSAPLIPITGEWDCSTQQAMVMEAGGALGVNPSTLNKKVADIGPLEFTYILSRSPVIGRLINDVNFTPNAQNANNPFDMNLFTGDFTIVAPIAKQGDPNYLPLKFVGATASTDCANAGAPPNDNNPPSGKETKSYFWPAVGGITAGVVVIGVGYMAFSGKSHKSSPASSY